MAARSNMLAAMDTEQGAFPPSPMDAAAPEPGTGDGRGDRTCAYVFYGFLIFLTCMFLGLIVEAIMYKDPNYSVAIAAVSGLDPGTDIGRRPVLDPEFNLTVVVARRSPGLIGCGNTATTVRVSYQRIELASADAPDFCEAEGRQTIIARGGHMCLPAPALGSLAADMRRGAGVFDVTITISNSGDESSQSAGTVYGLVISCNGRRVGEDVGGTALCDLREVIQERTVSYTPTTPWTDDLQASTRLLAWE